MSTLTAARVALLRRLVGARARCLHSTSLRTSAKRLVTKIMGDQPDPPWIDRIWDDRGEGYTLVLEPAGRAALQDAEAADGE